MSIFVCMFAWHPRLCISGAKLSRVHLRYHGRVIYDTTVGSSTIPRLGHLRYHGRVIYDTTIGSSTIPRSGSLSFIFSKLTQPLPFLRTIELLFVVITYNCPQRYGNNYVPIVDNVVSLFLDCPKLRNARAWYR